jgi:hypothetical protein
MSRDNIIRVRCSHNHQGTPASRARGCLTVKDRTQDRKHARVPAIENARRTSSKGNGKSNFFSRPYRDSDQRVFIVFYGRGV